MYACMYVHNIQLHKDPTHCRIRSNRLLTLLHTTDYVHSKKRQHIQEDPWRASICTRLETTNPLTQLIASTVAFLSGRPLSPTMPVRQIISIILGLQFCSNDRMHIPVGLVGPAPAADVAARATSAAGVF